MSEPVPLPASVSVSVNGETVAVAPGTTLEALVASLTGAPSGVAAALNETVVPRGQWPAAALADGDRVEVLTAVQGG
ncbi:sulfur carrier protein ThiS [Streptomyces sp. NBC_00338]|uniref:sulfur carrier protein ThiS n=1 Tax=Streptomyces sp. NBC_00338 TaxID=2975715 RepID=UPI00225A5215|nr:sulfur carrier protein ThiS [Streptomyces sp. NBC_00338]MCX5139716.1 sulfur carrier protein ThiS [Streptomyces sp. NBC_00338]